MNKLKSIFLDVMASILMVSGLLLIGVWFWYAVAIAVCVGVFFDVLIELKKGGVICKS